MDLIVIVGIIILITLMHYYTSFERTEYHAFSALLYYIPIIYSAFRFGLKGGAVTGLLVSVIYAPYLIMYRHELSPELVVKVLDVLLYNGIGWITGGLVEAEHHQKHRYLQALEQLQESNRALEQKIREKNELEEQVRRADKLAALGLLVSGIAHELRNPLGILKATVQVMETELRAHPEVKEFTAVVKEEAERMNKVIQEFLDFARPTPLQLEMTDVKALLTDVLLFVRKYLDQQKIKVFTNYSTELPLICIDEKQIRQVFINLILNSTAAIEDAGSIEIETRADRRYITVCFKDTGRGIPIENLDKIFDPFFTTKDTGTGLGLAVVHRIIDSHAGFIEVESKLGKGTEFRIYLPLEQKAGEHVNAKNLDH